MSRLRVGVLASGGGTTFQNLVECSRDGRLDADIAVLLVSRAGIGAVARAERLGVPCVVLKTANLRDPAALGAEIGAALDSRGVDLVAMAGFLKLWTIPAGYRGRVLNIHPALLPDFGGRGMYGHHVHEAVVKAGAKESGCTVHFADDEYDHGEIVLQRRVAVLPTDDADALAARVMEAERIAYPEAIRNVAASLGPKAGHA